MEKPSEKMQKYYEEAMKRDGAVRISGIELLALKWEVAQLEAENEQLLKRAESAEAVVAKIPQTMWENIIDELYDEAQALGGER